MVFNPSTYTMLQKPPLSPSIPQGSRDSPVVRLPGWDSDNPGTQTGSTFCSITDSLYNLEQISVSLCLNFSSAQWDKGHFFISQGAVSQPHSKWRGPQKLWQWGPYKCSMWLPDQDLRTTRAEGASREPLPGFTPNPVHFGSLVCTV